MGRIVFANVVDGNGLDATWYFKRLRYRHPVGDKWRRWIDWHETVKHTYPHVVYVDREALGLGDIERLTNTQLENRRAIRKFVEGNQDGECFVRYENLSFRYKWKEDSFGYDGDWSNVTHGYYVFYFEHAQEAVAFKLRFSDFVRERQMIPEEYDYLSEGQRKSISYGDTSTRKDSVLMPLPDEPGYSAYV